MMMMMIIITTCNFNLSCNILNNKNNDFFNEIYRSKANPTADDKKLIQNILYFSTTELNRNISIFENEKKK